MINIQFARLADGALPMFVRTDEEQPEGSIVTADPSFIDWPRTEVYVYDDEYKKWLPRRTFSQKILVGLYDLGAPTAPWYLTPGEHRLWNEHRLRSLTHGLRGDGVLTFAYRNDSLWGLTWSKYPLRAVASLRWVPPDWWTAENVWESTIDDLQRKIEAINHQALVEQEAQYYARLNAAREEALWRHPDDIARERAEARARSNAAARRFRDVLHRALA